MNPRKGLQEPHPPFIAGWSLVQVTTWNWQLASEVRGSLVGLSTPNLVNQCSLQGDGVRIEWSHRTPSWCPLENWLLVERNFWTQVFCVICESKKEKKTVMPHPQNSRPFILSYKSLRLFNLLTFKKSFCFCLDGFSCYLFNFTYIFVLQCLISCLSGGFIILDIEFWS